MNPLMWTGLLPDGRQASRDAAAGNACLVARRRRGKAIGVRLMVWRPVPQP